MSETTIRNEGDGLVVTGPNGTEYLTMADACLYCDPLTIATLTERMASDLDAAHAYPHANALGEGPNVIHRRLNAMTAALWVILGELIIFGLLWAVCHFFLRH